MRPLWRAGWMGMSCCIAGMTLAAWSQQGGAGATAGAPTTNPALKQRPAVQPKNMVLRDGAIKINAVVTDASGKPVTDLQPWDFKLLDNGQPRKILSFRKFDGVAVKPDPPVEVILVMDVANIPFQQVAIVRQEADQFLRQNGGHLQQPVSLILLKDAGIEVQPRPSYDGNAIAAVMHGIQGDIRTIDAAMGGYGLLERFQLSVRQMAVIADNEAKKPGRKLLIWLGPGWPILNWSDLGNYSEKDQRRYFDAIVELSASLREAQMAVYSVAPPYLGTKVFLYQAFLKGVTSAQKVDPGNLALRVLATQSGGLVMTPDNDMAGQINRCVADANAYYRIGFDPPAAEHADEYHELKLVADRPGLTVRTMASYYDEPAGAATGGQ